MLLNSRSDIKKRREQTVVSFRKKNRQQGFLNIGSLSAKLSSTNILRFRRSWKSGISIVLVIFVLVMIVVYFTYKTTRTSINNLEYVEKSQVTAVSAEFLKNKAFFQYSENDLAGKLKESNPLIEEVFINKSFVFGTVLDVREYKPVVVVQVNDTVNYFVTNSNKVIPYIETYQKELPFIQFEGSKEDLEKPIAIQYAQRAVNNLKKLEEIGINGTYRFDLFGNFSILTIENKTVQIDLKEKYFSLDDQLKIIKKGIDDNGFENIERIDSRFSTLIVKVKK